MSDFDVIVVGGGSAGATLAGELTRLTDLNVLLIEAGRRDWNPWIHIPATFFKALQNGKDAVVHEGEPEEALGGRSWIIPQGRVLGGGSSVNAMLYVRGQPQDYDGWAAMGATGWGWDDVFPVFKRLEGNATYGAPYHGESGPLGVSSARHRHPLSEAFVTACHEAQIRPNDDFNGERQDGAGFYQTTTRNGRRSSSAQAFLRPARRRANLTVMTGATVDRVLIENGRATGVRLADGREVAAAREVVLAAGALVTPTILGRSGIGAAAMLDSHGIPVIADLPGVGANLQDHAIVPIEVESREPISIYGENRFPRGPLHMLRYLATRKGLLSSNMVEAGGFVDVTGEGRPNIQMHFMPGFSGATGVDANVGHGVIYSVCVLRPKSRGRVTLASRDPNARGLFTSGTFTHPDDLALSLKGLRMGLSLLDQPALKAALTNRRRPQPGPDTDETLLQHIRDHTKTVYHPAGTAKMGDRADEGAVVDSELRVHEISGLRVADASVMPTITSGNTNAPTIMIGARAAEFIAAS